MKNFTNLISALVLIILSTQFVLGQTNTFYDFNTAGQLSGNFNKTGSSTNITQTTNTGLSNSGAVNITSTSTDEVFTTKSAYSLGNVGSQYVFTSYIKSVWNSGYSGLGFT